MTHADTIGRSMLDVGELADQLTALGLTAGDTVLVHSSMRRIGAVRGGAAGMIAALRAVIGWDDGTVVVPAFTPGGSETSDEFRKATAGMNAAEIDAYRASLPPFDVAASPVSLDMGVLPEVLRTSPGSLRSAHPMTSFAAAGRRAPDVVEHHDPTCHLGERSPLARLYDIPDSKILLLGTTFSVCTAFHLAEYRVPGGRRRIYRCVMPGPDGHPVRWSFGGLALDDSDFGAIGADLRQAADVADAALRTGTVGAAPATVLSFRAAVDYAVDWLPRNRVKTA